MIFKTFALVSIFMFTNVSGKKYLITLQNGITTDSIDPRIVLTEEFEIGDFRGLVAESDYTIEEIEVLDYIKNVEENKEIALDYQWGLDRVDQEDLPLDEKTFDPENTGDGIRIYILDTGIRTTHDEFENRAAKGWDFAYNDSNPDDKNGHGTHVASTATGKNVGVASGAIPVAVKVLNDLGNGFLSNVIKGIEWSVKDALKNDYCGIISMSLGGGTHQILNEAVNKAVEQGLNVVVSAGNDMSDACYKSPASATKAITVGASTPSDNKATYSNYGPCVNIFAPGSDIAGAWMTSDASYNTISGTSMAAPHVSGALAIYLKKYGCAADVTHFINSSSNDKLSNIPPNTVNKLLNINTPPFSKCPPILAIKKCIEKKNGKPRGRINCNKRDLCSWCVESKQCHPINFCNTPYKHCNTNNPTTMPTNNPTTTPTNNPTTTPTNNPTTTTPTNNPTTMPTNNPTTMPTNNPTTTTPTNNPTTMYKIIDWGGPTTFELNGRLGKIKINDVIISRNRKGRILTWNNDLVKSSDVVFMSISGYTKHYGIPNVLIQNISNGIIKFTLANSDGNNKILNNDIIVNFVIL